MTVQQAVTTLHLAIINWRMLKAQYKDKQIPEEKLNPSLSEIIQAKTRLTNQPENDNLKAEAFGNMLQQLAMPFELDFSRTHTSTTSSRRGNYLECLYG